LSNGAIDRLRACTGFQWDTGNREKNWIKHRVTASECEQVFFNQPLVAANDEKHSRSEERFFALGQTNQGRLLFVVYAIRGRLIRIIFARDMNETEREVYKSS
jgi:hypothetical protein